MTTFTIDRLTAPSAIGQVYVVLRNGVEVARCRSLIEAKYQLVVRQKKE